MLQFYFLSVFLNLFTGFVLVNERRHIIELPLFDDKVFRIVLGVLCTITGFIKLFVVVHTSVVIIGDFIPALAGIFGGITLFIQEQGDKFPDWFQKIFITNKFILGIVCLCAAFLHFVVPGALFL